MERRIRKMTYRRETEYQSLRSFVKQLERPENKVAALIAEALAQELTPRQKQMVTMYYLEQHTMREIAKLLGVNPSTVTRTLQSARAKLKVCLQYGGKALLEAEKE